MAGASSLLADLRSALDRLTRPPVATAAAALMLALLLAVVGTHLASLRPPSGGNIDIGTGDFLPFWTGATLIHDGRGDQLYELPVQQAEQAAILGGRSPELQPYLNPPLLALVLSLLVPLGYLPAFYVWDLACVVALAIGIARLLTLCPAIRTSRVAVATAVLAIASWQPVLQTTLAGQNSPLTFALVALFAAALARGSALAGIWLGLLSYKPQYAVGIGCALLLAGRLRPLAVAVAVAAVHLALGMAFCGAAWPLEMLALMRTHLPAEMAANGFAHFSWIAVMDRLLASPWDRIASAAGVAAVLFAFWRLRRLADSDTGLWLAAALCGTMLISPHLQYYDAALLAIPACLLTDRDLASSPAPPLAPRLLLLAVYAGYPLWEHGRETVVQPLFFALAGTAVWSLRVARAQRAPRGGTIIGASRESNA